MTLKSGNLHNKLNFLRPPIARAATKNLDPGVRPRIMSLTAWDDPRPQPTQAEVDAVSDEDVEEFRMDKITDRLFDDDPTQVAMLKATHAALVEVGYTKNLGLFIAEVKSEHKKVRR